MLSCALFIRDESKNISKVLDSLIDQTAPFDHIFVVDDCSLDNTVEIVRSKGLEPIRLITRHPSFIATDKLSLIANECIRAVYTKPVNFFAITGGDIVLDKDYNETLLRKFNDDPDLMVASGWIRDEIFNPDFPRGCCRFYRFRFWDHHVKAFPYAYSWESYPVYKALSLGYRARAFKDAKMRASRPTRDYKGEYGYAMRELGYNVLYAVAKCGYATLKDPRTGLAMTRNYLFSPYKEIDPDVSAWIRQYQKENWIKNVKLRLNL